MDAPRRDERLQLVAQRLEWREIDDEIVALDLDADVYLSISRTGAIVWTALADGASREELIERVLARFRVERDEAARDLDVFLDDLDKRGLLVRAAA